MPSVEHFYVPIMAKLLKLPPPPPQKPVAATPLVVVPLLNG